MRSPVEHDDERKYRSDNRRAYATTGRAGCHLKGLINVSGIAAACGLTTPSAAPRGLLSLITEDWD